MIEDDRQFLEVTALGSKLAWRVMKLWMKSAGRTLNNYQVRSSFKSLKDIREYKNENDKFDILIVK